MLACTIELTIHTKSDNSRASDETVNNHGSGDPWNPASNL